MKRKIFILFLLFLSISFLLAGEKTIGQSRDDQLKKALNLREELHRRMFEHFFKDSLSTDDIFKDLDPLFDDSFSGLSSDLIGRGDSGFEMSWSESAEGKSLFIKPKDKNQKIEINVQDGMIQLKGKSESKTEYGTSVSHFSHSYSVPEDCDWKRVKIVEKDGSIVLSFPFYGSENRTKNREKNLDTEERRPIKPDQGDIEI